MFFTQGATLFNVLKTIHANNAKPDETQHEEKLVKSVVAYASDLAIAGMCDNLGLKQSRKAVLTWYAQLPE